MDDAPALPNDVQDDAPLPLAGFSGTPAEIERQWYEQVYTGRGDRVLQLTWRSVLMGSLLGGVMSLTNLYVGLKTGWGFGVAITACILSYAIWTTLHRLRIARTRMTILENNCMQSTASAAGYSTGGTLVSAIAAYMIVHGQTIATPTLMAWVFFLAVLGVTMAIPMKRQMINVEQLRFPGGVAAAETLRALHRIGGRGASSAKALGVAGILAAISTFLSEGVAVVREKLSGLEGGIWRRLGEACSHLEITPWVERVNSVLFGAAWTERTVRLVWEPIFIAAGAITGLRVCASMFLGGTLCWAVFIPFMQRNGAIHGGGYAELVQWTLWGGASCMVTSGLLSFALQWRMALRAFAGVKQLLLPRRSADHDPLLAIETPGWWFAAGQIGGTIGLAWIGKTAFGMPAWVTLVAVAFSFILALVACRVTGETDTTPVGAMGKVTQLTFGAIRPGDTHVNLMGACITAGAADSASDLLLDLKSGYLLGANPRKQFIAQFAGIFMGTVASVIGFQLIVTDAAVLGSDRFPAPSAQAWSAMAQAMSGGITHLAAAKVWTIIIGGAVGIALPLLERIYPHHRRWIPSAAALGLAWTFHWYYSLLFFLGAVIGSAVQRRRPRLAEDYLYPVAAGVIAGGSLMGVAIIFLANGPEIVREFWQQLVSGAPAG